MTKNTPPFLIDAKHLGQQPGDLQADMPAGKLRMVITYLEMTSYPKLPKRKSPVSAVAVIRAYNPTVSYYRYLYDAVGKPWLWYERRMLSDDELSKIIRHPEVYVYVIYVRGTPVGFSELDYRDSSDVKIAYFGLVPEYIGHGLGTYFLEKTVQTGWSEDVKRMWVTTCNFDHPRAISTYQKVGFSPYKQEIKIIDDPTDHMGA